ncbi:hypothetical protein AMS68_000558 [Peltaster fructicola]|uniref:Uncharacterized protein n=1 Tax=Peltaster fructicola TaxID=286661 RepID=A0A6H0XK74_9PEZI|nr:hypothetical protein AMS68_000558 [Peltaster fructicola]
MSVKTSMPFLRRSDKWDINESYPVGATTDLKTDVVSDIVVEDVRGYEADLTFERSGIEVLKLNTVLALHDFHDQARVEEIYCVEVAEAILERLGGSSIQIFEAQVRRRDPGFPGSVVGIGGMQPALRPHIDISSEHALVKMASLNPDNAAQLQQREWICVKSEALPNTSRLGPESRTDDAVVLGSRSVDL